MALASIVFAEIAQWTLLLLILLATTDWIEAAVLKYRKI